MISVALSASKMDHLGPRNGRLKFQSTIEGSDLSNSDRLVFLDPYREFCWGHSLSRGLILKLRFRATK